MMIREDHGNTKIYLITRFGAKRGEVGASREGLANTLIYFMLLFVYTTARPTRVDTLLADEQTTTPTL